MTEYVTQTDIGNRALQWCGAELMDATLGFTEVSKNARQVSFAYGKVRRAELARNIWTFATRRAALRPIDSNTMLLLPTLWVSGATYFVGSIVADSANNYWISNTPNNLGNVPGGAVNWEPYFGPLTVTLYDSTLTYFAGELVYTAPGDGTYNVYLSLENANALDPSVPNEWSSSTTYFKNDVVQVYPAWASGTTYAAGAVAQYTDGNWYASLVAGNVGNVPPSSSAKWALVPVVVLASLQAPNTPLLTPPTSSPVAEWSILTTYGLGSFVMFAGTEYVSIAANNTGNLPNAAGSTFWAALSLGTSYMSLIDLNIGNNPSNAPALWSSLTTYSTGQKVGGSDGSIYSSVGSGNLNHNPVGDGGVHWTNTGVLNPWTTVFTQGGGNQQWVQVGGSAAPSGVALTEIDIVYPLGSGPVSQNTTRNAFRLPNGFLKPAPEDPKAGSMSWLGAPSGLPYRDWTYEGNYFVSRETGPILFRFIADVTDVSQMKDMFCEGLACRLAEAISPHLTQSSLKLKDVTDHYNVTMREARVANLIEIGAIETAVDDWIACRV